RAKPAGELEEDERKHRGEEGEVRLVSPGAVNADDCPADAEGQQRAHGVTVAEVDGERRLVGGRGEPGEAMAVIHHTVRQREERRRVVELDAAGEGRLA